MRREICVNLWQKIFSRIHVKYDNEKRATFLFFAYFACFVVSPKSPHFLLDIPLKNILKVAARQF